MQGSKLRYAMFLLIKNNFPRSKEEYFKFMKKSTSSPDNEIIEVWNMYVSEIEKATAESFDPNNVI